MSTAYNLKKLWCLHSHERGLGSFQFALASALFDAIGIFQGGSIAGYLINHGFGSDNNKGWYAPVGVGLGKDLMKIFGDTAHYMMGETQAVDRLYIYDRSAEKYIWPGTDNDEYESMNNSPSKNPKAVNKNIYVDGLKVIDLYSYKSIAKDTLLCHLILTSYTRSDVYIMHGGDSKAVYAIEVEKLS